MKLSNNGLEFLKATEKFVPHIYPDHKGYSIGYGCLLSPSELPAFQGKTITEDEASAMLLQRVQAVEIAINSMVKVPLTQNQYDALVSFVYNVGIEAFRTSTLLHYLNIGEYRFAAAQFARWTKARNKDGKVVITEALVRRRIAEEKLFLS